MVLPIVIAGSVFLLIVLALCMYVKATPAVAYIISGLRKQPRILIGKGTVRIPILERLDKLFLGQVTVDVKTSVPVPTHDYIDVMVDAVCKLQVDVNQIQLAARNFLNMSERAMAEQVKDSLEGNMREVIGAINLQNLITDRDAFSDQIQKKAAADMSKLGLNVISCNIQNIQDKNGLIENLGADNTYKIRKEAAITKANAERDIKVAQALAAQESNNAQVASETVIAEKQNELAIKKADLKKASDIKKAEADAAYAIQEQEQLKTVNVAKVEAEAAKQIRAKERQKEINVAAVEADVAKAMKEQELREQEIAIRQKQLEAEVNKQAEADKFQKETNAAAELEQRKRRAEAEAYEAEQKARAIKAKAEADLFAAEQEANGIKAKGIAEATAKQAVLMAEAEGIRAKGMAEAEAMEKKAEAYQKSEFAKLEMLTELQKAVLPAIAENIAKPMGNIDSINVYGTSGTEASGVAANVPTVMRQTFDVMKSATGVDMVDLVNAHSIHAQTDRNVNIEGDGLAVVTK